MNFCPSCGGDLRGIGALSDTFSGAQRAERAAQKDTGPALGSVIDDRYLLKEKLGEGGMGAVYKVEHVRMGKAMALKLMRPEAALDRVSLKRFQQEARIVSKLSHANTVCVFDFGELADGALYMAMEYVPGRDLSFILRAEGNFSERRAIPVVTQVLRSLAEAHEHGIIHRDIKPANVMLLRTREGEDFAKVVDFGIAKLAEAAAKAGPDKKAITGMSEFVGTPNYMSPEQVKGDDLDPRSDLYSVGAMLFELLTGRPPFLGEQALAIAAKHLTEKPISLAAAAPRLAFTPAMEAVVAKALAKSPKDRFRSADEMRAALEAAREPGARTGTTGKLPSAQLLDHTTGGLEIARRDDWDSFEKTLRWKRTLMPLFALAAVAISLVALWTEVLRDRLYPKVTVRTAVTREVEPNDGPNTANLIEPGKPVEGLLLRAVKERADVDVYEFTVPGPTPKLAQITVSGVPNVNVSLDLFERGEEAEPRSPDADPSAPAEEKEQGPARKSLRPRGQVDDQFVGGDETMSDLLLAPGRYFVRVQDKRRAGEPSTVKRENGFDPYTLKVVLSEPTPLHEEEPDNTLDTPMVLTSARGVFGHAGARGEMSHVTTATGEQGLAGTLWSDDYYEVKLGDAKETCLVLSGVNGAALALSLVSTEQPRIRAIADPTESARALSEHLARTLREKPARVAADEVDRRCARAAESAVFKVQVAEGASDGRYVLLAVDDSEGGFAGAIQACERLVAGGEAALCRKLLAKAIQALPNAKGVGAAKGFLDKLP